MREVSALGFDAISSPVLDLTARSTGEAALSAANPASADGVVFTSANGVRFFSDICDIRSKPVWCVGPATADAARAHGFSDCRASSGDAENLAQFIEAQSDGKALRLIHVANAAARGNLKARLESIGFTIDFVPLYEAVAATSLTPAAQSALSDTAPTLVLIHSAKGAAAFANLLPAHQQSPLHIVAISQRASEPVSNIGAATLTLASHPDEAHLLEVLQTAASRL